MSPVLLIVLRQATQNAARNEYQLQRIILGRPKTYRRLMEDI